MTLLRHMITDVLACQATLAETVMLELEMGVRLAHVRMGEPVTFRIMLPVLPATALLALWATIVNFQQLFQWAEFHGWPLNQFHGWPSPWVLD